MAEDPYKTTIRLPPELADRLDEMLMKGKLERSLPRSLTRNGLIVRLLQEKLGMVADVPAGPEQQGAHRPEKK